MSMITEKYCVYNTEFQISVAYVRKKSFITRAPDDVKNQQDREQKVEDVVRRKHLNDLWSFEGGAVKNPGRVESEPGGDPGQGEADEDGVAHALVR